jgi:protein-S-isoprenylcysteine O-methyltransferase Ste14
MPFEVKVLIFLVVTTGIAFLTRASLRSTGMHGFYRFFAWEVILALFFLNVEHWFVDPFSVNQLLSWLLLFLSLVPLILGVRKLRGVGQPSQERQQDGLLAFEKTTSLVTSGIYRYIRHPMYTSLLYLAWGIFFKWLTWPGLVLVLAATFLLTATARVEEAENSRFFGPEYREYMLHSKMFIPYLF